MNQIKSITLIHVQENKGNEWQYKKEYFNNLVDNATEDQLAERAKIYKYFKYARIQSNLYEAEILY